MSEITNDIKLDLRYLSINQEDEDIDVEDFIKTLDEFAHILAARSIRLKTKNIMLSKLNPNLRIYY